MADAAQEGKLSKAGASLSAGGAAAAGGASAGPSSPSKTPASAPTAVWVCPSITCEADLQAAIAAIKGNPNLPQKAHPQLPTVRVEAPIKKRLAAVQRFINQFEYNLTGTNYFDLRRDLGMSHLVSTAKHIIAEALPIQCVEAVFLAGHLTSAYKDLVRVPLSFKSIVDGITFRHIVLAVQHGRKWGALGISRKSTLMDKEVEYDSLGSLVSEYKRRYEECDHELLTVYVSFPLAHDAYSQARIKWRVQRLSTRAHKWSDIVGALNKYARSCAVIKEQYQALGHLPAHFREEYCLSGHANSASAPIERDSRGKPVKPQFDLSLDLEHLGAAGNGSMPLAPGPFPLTPVTGAHASAAQEPPDPALLTARLVDDSGNAVVSTATSAITSDAFLGV